MPARSRAVSTAKTKPGRVDALLKALTDPNDREAVELKLLRALRTARAPVRLRVAKQLARWRQCPPRVVRLLAHDRDEEVAATVLSACPGLSDEALAELARCTDQPHLRAIARRPHLPAHISRILVRRGDDAVLEALASNQSASIPASSRLRMLVRLARAHSIAPRRRQGAASKRPSAAGHNPSRGK